MVIIKCQIIVIFHITYRFVLQVIHYKNPQFDIKIVFVPKLRHKTISFVFYTFI